MQERVALVTGASGGLGAAIAARLANSKRASGPMAAYAMTKAALNTLVVYLAQEVGHRQVTCNAPGVGPVEREASAAFFEDAQRKEEILLRAALGRFAVPEDVGGAVCLFVSPASGCITGQYAEVSGGYCL